ncbi:MAG: LysR substrate-binding domain-containing protein [Spongiibacteraceae bacterium]
MDIRRLRYFLIAAEEENLRRAAERLHIVQPALSKQIAQLEDELGCQLFTRAKQRIALTSAGRLFMADARRILADLEAAKERLQEASAGQLGTLNIGFRETAARSPLVSRSISEFRSAYPNVELRLNQMTSPAQCAALRNGELDTGFIYLSPEHDKGLEHLPIGDDRFMLALHRGNPLAKKKLLSLDDLVNQPFIWLARSRNAYYSDALLRDCHQLGFSPRVIQEADSDATALNLVAVGMGISFVVAATSPPPDVVLKPVRELDHSLTLALAWNPANYSPLVDHFIGTVRQIIATTPAAEK